MAEYLLLARVSVGVEVDITKCVDYVDCPFWPRYDD